MTLAPLFSSYTNGYNITYGIYSDNGSGTAPSALLGQTAYTSTLTNAPVVPFFPSPVAVTAGTYYWLAVYTSLFIYYDNNGTGVTAASQNFGLSNSNPLPSTFSGSTFPSGEEISIEADICN
jgi:hypothetical protein